MRFVSLLLIFLPISTFPQVYDNFADSNYTSNPVWFGDTGDFIINGSKQLQLNSSGSDTSILYTNNIVSLNNKEWNIWLRMAFSPSDNNLARIYLASDKTNLKGALNGYFLRLGENGSFDSIDLWKQSGTAETKIIDGINSHTAKSTNTLRIKVTRDSVGIWNLFADTLGGYNYVPEGSILDSAFKTTSYFGVYCKYTSSNANKFYFDDIYMGPIVIDTTGPLIDSLDVINSNMVDVFFNEPLEEASAETVGNYTVNNGLGSPLTSLLDTINTKLVHLSFSGNFLSGQQHLITINNIKDIIGNTNTSVKDSFLFYEAIPFDINVNEIMADPDPPAGLPNYEYLEIHNTSFFPVKLHQWTITIGTNTKTIPAFVLMPDSFVVLASANGATALSGIARSIAVSGFPALTNTGQTVILKNNKGRIISAVSYSDKWYKDVNKEEGGYSLEQIDPLNPCAGENNWKASTHTSGGTPGKKNSAYALNPDVSAPYIKYATIIDSLHVKITFNEPLDSISLVNTSSYLISDGVGNPVSIQPIGPFYSSVIITLANPLQQKIIYTVSLTNTITDCKGNILQMSGSVKIAIPETLVANDIVINEILYDPKDNGVEFVEVVNRSEKTFELKNLRLSSYDTIASQLLDLKIVAPDGLLIFPGEYKLLSSSTSTVKAQYNSTSPAETFIQMLSLPSLNNNGDAIALSDSSGQLIDMVVYSPEMHYPLLKETKGVSLERIDFNRPSGERTNWHSAASTAGFATPGYKNSQYAQYTGNAAIGISPEIFSPDNDAYNDVLNIHYSIEGQGYTGNITIYNSSGKLIKNLVKSELLSNEGTYTWDGTGDNREKAPIGIYIIYFEAFNLNGNIEKHKIPCVLGGKLQ